MNNINWLPYWLEVDENGEPDTYGEHAALEAGNLVKTAEGRILLVGDINLRIGTCGCCEQENITDYSNDLLSFISGVVYPKIHNEEKL